MQGKDFKSHLVYLAIQLLQLWTLCSTLRYRSFLRAVSSFAAVLAVGTVSGAGAKALPVDIYLYGA